MPHRTVKIDDVPNLFDQGFAPSQDLSREESIELGYMVDDTKKTRLVQYKGELVEIDYRKRVSKNGSRIVWVSGHNPETRKKWHESMKERDYAGPGRPRGGKNLSSVLKQWMNADVTKTEFDKLPGPVRHSLEQYLGRGLTRKDVAAFALMGKAMTGDILAFKEIADRTEGKALQRTENKNLNANYADFVKGLAEFDDEDGEDDDEGPVIDL